MTMDLAPVLDTASPTDTVAGENYRSFSENGQVAASYGVAYANGLRAAGIVPVAKHFPGLGPRQRRHRHRHRPPIRPSRNSRPTISSPSNRPRLPACPSSWSAIPWCPA